jgi:hypothetical protein
MIKKYKKHSSGGTVKTNIFLITIAFFSIQTITKDASLRSLCKVAMNASYILQGKNIPELLKNTQVKRASFFELAAFIAEKSQECSCLEKIEFAYEHDSFIPTDENIQQIGNTLTSIKKELSKIQKLLTTASESEKTELLAIKNMLTTQVHVIFKEIKLELFARGAPLKRFYNLASNSSTAYSILTWVFIPLLYNAAGPPGGSGTDTM